MPDGFLGRWSQRKLAAKEGTLLDADPTPLVVAAVDAPTVEATAQIAEETPVESVAEIPAPTLEDVRALTAESDFSRFAARNVAADVKNAAMKKLFSDPRYNVMDGMDVYVGDYSKPNPIPSHMLRQLATVATLKLFDEEPARAATPEQPVVPRDVAHNPTIQSVEHSNPAHVVLETPCNADPDLRLQQDHAAPREDSRRGTG